MLLAFDKNGCMRTTGGDRVSCLMVNQETGQANLCEVDDMQDGRYEVVIRQDKSGFYEVYFFVHGQKTHLSPYCLDVRGGNADGANSFLRFQPLLPCLSLPAAEFQYEITAGQNLYLNFVGIDRFGNDVVRKEEFKAEKLNLLIGNLLLVENEDYWITQSNLGTVSIKIFLKYATQNEGELLKCQYQGREVKVSFDFSVSNHEEHKHDDQIGNLKLKINPSFANKVVVHNKSFE